MSEPEQPSNPSVQRRLNLLRLLREYTEKMIADGASAKGIEQNFADHVEVSPVTLSQLKGSRAMGSKLARQIEGHCGKSPGWMDEDHGSDVVSSAEERFLSLAREAWRSSGAAGRRILMRTAESGFKRQP